MKENMANPNFWAEKEEILQKARDKVLKERMESQKTEEQIYIIHLIANNIQAYFLFCM